MQSPGFESYSALQSFQQRNVFGNIVVLMPDPFGDSNSAMLGTVNDHSNARRPRVPQGATIHVGH